MYKSNLSQQAIKLLLLASLFLAAFFILFIFVIIPFLDLIDWPSIFQFESNKYLSNHLHDALIVILSFFLVVVTLPLETKLSIFGIIRLYAILNKIVHI